MRLDVCMGLLCCFAEVAEAQPGQAVLAQAVDESSSLQGPTDPAAAPGELALFQLEDKLATLVITTATKSETNLSEVPAMVEVVLAAQIRERGYRHLGDVLNDIVTNHIDRSNWGIGEPVTQNVGFGLRFDTAQNILLLFNGQRLNGFLGGNRFGFEEYLLDNVDRIEIIRGPGSALYGANAFTAVINVISKIGLDDGERPFARAAAGGLFTSGGGWFDGSWKARLGQRGFLSGAIRVGGERGQTLHVQNRLYGDQDLRDGVRYAVDGDVFFSYGRFRTYFKFDHQLRDIFTGLNAVSPSDDDRLNLLGFAYALGADYTHDPHERVRLKYSVGLHLDGWSEVALVPVFKLTDMGRRLLHDASGNPVLDTVAVNRDGKEISTSFLIDGQTTDTLTADAEVQLTWKYWKSNNLIVGLNGIYDQLINPRRFSEIQFSPPAYVPYRTFDDLQNNWLSDPSAGRFTFGVYAQADHAVARQLFLNAGVRADVYTGTGALAQTYFAVNPRFGAVWRNRWVGNFKALFGQATRIPNGFEALAMVAGLGSPDNRPEQIYTIQTSWDRTWLGVFSTELGYFYSRISNHLTTDTNLTEEQRAQGFVAAYRNLPETPYSQGILAKLSLTLKHFYLSGNFTRYFATDDGHGHELPYIPLTMLNVNVGAQLFWFHFNFGINYRGGFSKEEADPRPAVSEYVLLNPTLIVSPPAFPLQIRVGGRNVLDYEVSYPSSSFDYNRNFPGRRAEAWADISYSLRF